MAGQLQNITVSLTAEQFAQLEEMKKLSGKDTTTIVRNALLELHKSIMQDEDIKQKEKLNSLLDVQ